MTVAERLARVRAALPPGVTLVAVSKAQPAAAVREAYAAGQRHFGENYVQEWREKAEALADLGDLSWHFVGSLQTNKVKYLVGRVALVHTVDRLDLAGEISRRSAQKGAATRILVEVNVAGETGKAGCAPAEVPALVEAVRAMPGLELRGLMCIPPAQGDPRPHFRTLRALRDRLGLAELSMGMSGDFPAAVEEGATLVRVGTAIFGERPARLTRP
ncbi:MAG TPA: YggS family pyridoxal phosphate-dependent enzyme [Anaeromyxobacteraceae bacterium]|nr:YggS family pyridoxal phosphate-dependent enzyme [Anaeromyxobacteraceae bacterium]